MTDSQNIDKNKKIQELQKELGIKNPMAIPTFSKIVINMGVKDALADKKNIEKANVILMQITGQKPKITKAKKAISGFKLRQGDQIGLVVTLRGKKMWDFFTKLVSIVLPRFRDFHGVSKKSFDGHGNYTLGMSESTVFPEIDPGKLDKIQGMEISIATTARNDEEGYALFKALGMPFAHEAPRINALSTTKNI